MNVSDGQLQPGDPLGGRTERRQRGRRRGRGGNPAEPKPGSCYSLPSLDQAWVEPEEGTFLPWNQTLYPSARVTTTSQH